MKIKICAKLALVEVKKVCTDLSKKKKVCTIKLLISKDIPQTIQMGYRGGKHHSSCFCHLGEICTVVLSNQ